MVVQRTSEHVAHRPRTDPRPGIVSPQRLQEIVKQIGGRSLESLDRAQVPDVARRAGAGAVVVGSIFKAGNEIRIDAQLEDLPTVACWWLKACAAPMCSRSSISWRRGSVTASGFMTPPVSAGYRTFQPHRSRRSACTRRVDAMSNSRMDDAEELLERAVAIDPTFADAYVQLANASRFRGFVGLQREVPW